MRRHTDWLAGHWPELAAAAFEGYDRHGAGAVVVWTASRSRWLRPFQPERLWYATQIHAIPGAAAADFDGWEARQLETYDPRAEALVVFASAGRPVGYRVAGNPAPPHARRLARAADN